MEQEGDLQTCWARMRSDNPGLLLSALRVICVFSIHMATQENIGHFHEMGVSLSGKLETKPQALSSQARKLPTK